MKSPGKRSIALLKYSNFIFPMERLKNLPVNFSVQQSGRLDWSTVLSLILHCWRQKWNLYFGFLVTTFLFKQKAKWMNKQVQKRAGAARHNEFSRNLLYLATLLNIHFRGRRQTFPTLFLSWTAKYQAVPLRKEYSKKAICGWALNPRKLWDLPLWVKKQTRHVFFS